MFFMKGLRETEKLDKVVDKLYIMSKRRAAVFPLPKLKLDNLSIHTLHKILWHLTRTQSALKVKKNREILTLMLLFF